MIGKIGKNYIYSVSYQILVLLAPIVTAPYLARVLGADNLGIYSYVSSSGSIISTVSLLGIYAYGNRQTAYVRENRERLTSTFWELELVRLVLGFGGTFIYFVYVHFNQEYNLFFCIYYPYILAQFVDCSWIYVGLENMKPAVIKNAAAKIATIAGIFILVKSEDDLWIYIMIIAVTTLIANAIIYTQLPHYVDGPRVNIQKIPEHLKGSISLFLPQVASLLYLQLDKVMLEWLTGETDQVAFYDQAEKIVTIPLTLITVISSVVMPRIANEFQKGRVNAINKLLLSAGKYALCMAMPMMLGMFCISRQLIGWYLGSEFNSTAIAIMILSPIILLNTLAGISGNQYFTATNQTGILLRAYVSAAAINIAVNALLIPRYGYIGAAIATVLSSLVSVITQYYAFTKQIPIKKLWSYLGRYLVGAIIMAVAIVTLTWKMSATAFTTFVQIVLGVAIYVLYLVVIKDSIVKELVSILKKGRRNSNGL